MLYKYFTFSSSLSFILRAEWMHILAILKMQMQKRQCESFFDASWMKKR